MLLIKPFPDKTQTFGDGCASKCVSQSVGGFRSPRCWANEPGPLPAPTLRDRPLGTWVGSAQSREANSSRGPGGSSSRTGGKLRDFGHDRMSLFLPLPTCVGWSQDLGSKASYIARDGLGIHSHPLVLGWPSSPGAKSAWTVGICLPTRPSSSFPALGGPEAWLHQFRALPPQCSQAVGDLEGPLSGQGLPWAAERQKSAQAPKEASCAWRALEPLTSPLGKGGWQEKLQSLVSCESSEGAGPAKGSWHPASGGDSLRGSCRWPCC